MAALRTHDAVLADPEPLVLVDELATSTVNLQIFFWVDGHEHSILKVRSAVLRRVKRCLQNDGFTLPDELREMIFPQGVPVLLNAADGTTASEVEDASSNKRKTGELSREAKSRRRPQAESNDDATEAEGGLESERHDIEK